MSAFLDNAPNNHATEINAFKDAKKTHVKFRSGNYFAFKLNRTQFGFGRILLDITKIKKKGLIPNKHGLRFLMAQPVLVQLFAYASTEKNINVSLLDNAPTLQSDFMMDNIIFYGEYEIIGHKDLREEDFEFPISYGKTTIDQQVVVLQWGLIYKELPITTFSKYLTAQNPFVPESSPSRTIDNPHRYTSIGFRPHFTSVDVFNAIKNGGVYDYKITTHFTPEFDLRNPKHHAAKREILQAFGLDPDKSYMDNCSLTNTQRTTDLIALI